MRGERYDKVVDERDWCKLEGIYKRGLGMSEKNNIEDEKVKKINCLEGNEKKKEKQEGERESMKKGWMEKIN